MHTKWFTLTEKAAHKKILPQLNGRVFHRTNIENLYKIIACGFIDNNQNESYKLNWQSNSYFRNRACVSVCDFYNNTSAKLTRKALYKYKIFSQREDMDDKFAFLFLSENAYHNLIPWEKYEEEKAFDEVVVPYLESGFPNTIPLSLISEVWLINITDKVYFPEIKYDPPEGISMRKELLLKKVQHMNSTKD